MNTVPAMLQPAPRELSPIEQRLVQALVNAIVRELKADRTESEAA